MNRVPKVSIVVAGGMLVLALAAGLQPAGPSRAQDPAPGPGAPDGRAGPLALPSIDPIYPEEEPDLASSHLQVSGAALVPGSSNYTERAVSEERYGCVYLASGNPTIWWSAPVYPPNAAILTELRAYVYDVDGTYDSYVYLAVLSAYGSLVDYWYGVSTGSTGYGTITINIPDHLVDYGAYSYLLMWLPVHGGPSMMNCGFRLSFVPPGGVKYLPAAMNDY